jgi:hypothetical protein
MKLFATGLAALTLAAMAGSASAASVNVWSTGFAGGYFETVGPFPRTSLGVTFGGGSIQGAQSLPGFGTDFFRNDTNGATTFAANGLGAHTALELSFDLAFLDSWDGNSAPGNCCSPDDLNVTIDGVAPLTFSWNGGNLASPAVFGPGTVVGTGHYGFNGSYTDAVVHYSFLFPHVSANWNMTIAFGGAGFQGGDDESWGIDNFSLAAVPVVIGPTIGVPEPASWALMIAGFGLAGAALRRRRGALA